MKVEPRCDVLSRMSLFVWRIVNRKKVKMEIDMKKTLFWVIRLYLPYSLCMANENS